MYTYFSHPCIILLLFFQLWDRVWPTGRTRSVHSRAGVSGMPSSRDTFLQKRWFLLFFEFFFHHCSKRKETESFIFLVMAGEDDPCSQTKLQVMLLLHCFTSLQLPTVGQSASSSLNRKPISMKPACDQTKHQEVFLWPASRVRSHAPSIRSHRGTKVV